MKVPKKRRPARITKAWRAVEWALKEGSEGAHVNIELNEVFGVGYYGSLLHYEGTIPPHVAIYAESIPEYAVPAGYDLKLMVKGTFQWRDQPLYIYYI